MRQGRTAVLSAIIVFIAGFGLVPAFAGSFDAFGPKNYERGPGQPVKVQDNFSVLNPAATYILHVESRRVDEDGDNDADEHDPRASARIWLNGHEVVSLEDFHNHGREHDSRNGDHDRDDRNRKKKDDDDVVLVIDKPVHLLNANALVVEVHGRRKTSVTVTVIGVDNDPPIITPSVSPAANAAGWNNTDVTVTFVCSDATSGIAVCPNPTVVSSEGSGQVVQGTATDKAGNSATAMVHVSIDKTPPTITATVTPAPVNGVVILPASGAVTVSFACADALSGIASCPGPIAVTTLGSNQVFSGTATDKAGNNATASVTLNVQAPSPLTISATVSSQFPQTNGWYRSDVTISYQCSGGVPPLQCPPAQTITSEGLDQQIVATVTDAAGEHASVITHLNVDKTPPTITASVSPSPNANGWIDSDAVVTFTCTDSLSGVNNCPPPQSVTDGANQVISGTATDLAGNSASTSLTLNIGEIPPSISASLSPAADNYGWNNSDVTVNFQCQAGTAPIAQCSPSQLISAEGGNQQILGTATDLAGNSTTATVTVNVDKAAPLISAAVSTAPNGAGWNNADVTVNFTCSDALSGIVICPDPIQVTEGANQVITGTATDAAGNTATSAAITLNIDETPPVVTITSPAPGSTISTSGLTLSGTVSDALSGVASVTCNGTAAVVTAGSFTCNLTLPQGADTVSLQATDAAGNTTAVPFQVNVVNGPKVTITSPTSLQLFSANPVTITGTIDDPQATVSANGIIGTVSGNSFTISGVTLHETKNLLTVTATNAAGGTGTAMVTVFLDTTPPQVHIDSPSDGAGVNTSQVTVMGNVNDLVSGTVNGNQVSVSVNGVNATVSNRSFAAQNILLVPGQNTITAIAKDKAGNTSQHQIQVTFRDATAAQHLVIISGNNQSGVINTVLAQPLVVQAVDGLGRPIVNRTLTFQVSRSDGTLTAGIQSGRNLTVVTDGNGQASVKFQLGSRSGVGINQLAVTAPGFVGDTVFYATSTVAAPALIHTVSGEVQSGAIGSALAEPLVGIVMDTGGNPVANVPVTFQVNAGNGTIDGGNSAVKTTDLDGKAFAVLTIGQQPGSNNNTVSATFAGNTGLPAQFVASGVITGPVSATTISGVVLDNASQPIPNARASVKGAQVFALTNAQGQFTIPGAPVGDVLLYVDGTFSTRPERFPTLSFQLTTLPGIDNVLPGPIYLPPIDSDNTQMIDNTSDQDVVLTVKGMPGVQYTVFAHSATFPDGSKSGSLSLSQVHVDRVPMTPANGTVPSFVTTLQPPGVSFDPPVRMQVPNTSGLLPGQVAEIFSYRHDLEQFVSEGTGRVSEDGSVITTDPGFGLHVSGWNLIPPPPVAPNTTCSCSSGPSSSAPISMQTSLLARRVKAVRSPGAAAAPVPACSVAPPNNTVDVNINGTPDPTDDITVLKPPLPIPIQIVLHGDAATVNLSVNPPASATLDQNSLVLPANGSGTVNLTPTAASQQPDDVTITATINGNQAGQGKLTIADVTIPAIKNEDTPAGMPDRIPPRMKTKITITVTPDLGTSGKKIHLVIQGNNATNGDLQIDGHSSEDITKTKDIQLKGTRQTAQTGAIKNCGAGAQIGQNAGNLKIVGQVHGTNAVFSSGFSVAAIPQGWNTVYLQDETNATDPRVPGRLYGMIVQETWSSDSGDTTDLDQVCFKESVGTLAGANGSLTVIGNNTTVVNNTYSGPMVSTVLVQKVVQDIHDLSNTLFTGVGRSIQEQTHLLKDLRTGAVDVSIPQSGYTITKELAVSRRANRLNLTVTKTGAAVRTAVTPTSAGAGNATTTFEVTLTGH